jgi:osmotically-inducible protein OsmY
MMQQLRPTQDQDLRSAVLMAFATDNRTSAADLRVGVSSGIAHLAGTVNTLATRAAAEALARQVIGVRGVVNRIEAPGAPSPARAITLTAKEGKLDET